MTKSAPGEFTYVAKDLEQEPDIVSSPKTVTVKTLVLNISITTPTMHPYVGKEFKIKGIATKDGGRQTGLALTLIVDGSPVKKKPQTHMASPSGNRP
jgi:hypothetical protein